MFHQCRLRKYVELALPLRVGDDDGIVLSVLHLLFPPPTLPLLVRMMYLVPWSMEASFVELGFEMLFLVPVGKSHNQVHEDDRR